MNTTLIATIVTPIVVVFITVIGALVGYLITYRNSIRLSQRTERLNRINRQLGELYGPLYSIVDTGNKVWEAFHKKYPHVDPNFVASEKELKDWQLWMTTVFMPQNLQVYELIISKADLLIGTDMPDCLKQFCAHIAVYKTVLKKWENQDFSEYGSSIPYPREEITAYSCQSFEGLKKLQAEMIEETELSS